MAELHFARVDNIKGYIFCFVVTSVATTGNAECNLGIMTCSTGTVFLHITHGISGAVNPADKNAAVAVNADIHFFRRIGMNLMTEQCGASPEINIRRSGMAFIAITSDRKGILAVMTATAGKAGLHILHQITLAVRTGDKQLAVTIPALIPHAEVVGMAEKRVSIEADIFNSVAFCTTAGNSECRLAVMASATRDTGLHLFHGDMRIGTICPKKFGVAVCAGKKCKVKFVTENYRSEIRNFDLKLFSFVTGGTL